MFALQQGRSVILLTVSGRCTHSDESVFTVSIKGVSFSIECDIMSVAIHCAGPVAQICAALPLPVLTCAVFKENKKYRIFLFQNITDYRQVYGYVHTKETLSQTFFVLI